MKSHLVFGFPIKPLLRAVSLVFMGGMLLTTAATVAAAKSAKAVSSSPTFKLRLRLERGDQFLYDLAFSGRATFSAPGKPMPPLQFSSVTRLRRTVVDAMPDGRYQIEEKLMGGEATFTAQGMTRKTPVKESPSQIEFVNALGRSSLPLKKTAGLQTLRDKFGFDLAQAVEPFAMLQMFPEETVRSGSAWHRKAGFRLPSGINFSIAIDNKLASLESVDNVSTAKVVSDILAPIKVRLSQPGGSLKIDGLASGGLRSNYSLATGMPVRIEGSIAGKIEIDASGENRQLPLEAKHGMIRFSVNYHMKLADAIRGVGASEIASGEPSVATPSESSPSTTDEKSPNSSAPSAELKIPTKGGIVSGIVPVQALVRDAGEEVSSVAFLVNGELAYSTNARPFRFMWNASALPRGIYLLSAEVYGANGELLAVSPGRQVQVHPAAPPKKSIDSTDA